MAGTQLLRDLRNLRAALHGGETLSGALARMAKEWPKERGLAVCRAIDAIETDVALVDAAIEIAIEKKAKSR